ncbi:MAG: DUF1549 domain-containing protein [Verrucomicrobiales bacterium]|nr:DUF1549 domain-containing protein [Verrucomicrobiales bacterium]
MKPLSILSCLILSLTCFLQAEVVPKPAAKVVNKNEKFDVAKAAGEIDALVEATLAKQGLKPNADIDDATFVRRAYLDIAGRVPTIEEAENFHGSTYPRKREQLITDLLESDGHMSHAYNFWADVLRINSGLGTGAQQAEAAYQLWIKESINNNVPYDQFVREMISARGMIWENGAVGYYIRDRGMPLDNMSNTVRIFLGTRLECAQCHNHPFDKWTQMDYFQMAAFSYGMDARGYDSPNQQAFKRTQNDERKAIHLKMVGNEKFPQMRNADDLKRFTESDKYDRYLKQFSVNDEQFRALAKKSIAAYEAYDHASRGANEALNELYNPLRYVKADEVKKTLKLPHDYKYTDAKPFQVVTGKTMFGKEIDLANIDDSTIDAYADWMVSKENPTFTRVIANRLWKRVFGHGVFEPVDELTEQTQISNPELLTYLETLMKSLDFDMRKYEEVLFNTKTYQRAANSEETVMGEHYYFAGPMLRRMSAEQIWDSIVALALPEADGYRPRVAEQLASVEKVRRIFKTLESRSEKDYIAMVKKIGETYEAIRPREEKVRKESAAALEAGDKERFNKLRNELNDLRNQFRKVVADIGYQNVGEKVDGGDLLAAMGMTEMQMGAGDNGAAMAGAGSAPGERAVMTKLPKPVFLDPPATMTDKNQRKAWSDRQKQSYRGYTTLVSQMARASELESPARRGHFLREFGQSDREVIENSANNASVPQALSLLNGPIVESLINPFAVFGRRIQMAGEPDEKIRMIFQAMLTRKPTEKEMTLARAEVAAHGDEAYPGIVWALLNTQQFIFVQ